MSVSTLAKEEIETIVDYFSNEELRELLKCLGTNPQACATIKRTVQEHPPIPGFQIFELGPVKQTFIPWPLEEHELIQAMLHERPFTAKIQEREYFFHSGNFIAHSDMYRVFERTNDWYERGIINLLGRALDEYRALKGL